MTFQFFDGFPQLDTAIIGTGINGSFVVSQVPHVSDLPPVLDTPINAIYFVPTTTVNHTSSDYISDPTLLVATAESGQITLAIAAYLLALIDRRDELLHHMTQRDALQDIMSRYPNPTKLLK